jgi:hypothetical protein
MEDLNPFFVKHIRDGVDHERLFAEVRKLIDELCYNDDELYFRTQLVLTSETGDPDDWFAGTGYNDDPAKFNKINPRLENSYMHELIKEFPDFNRWRIMVLPSRNMLSVHKDGPNNTRIHIPVKTNSNAWLVFYDRPLVKTGKYNTYHANLKAGSIYQINTDGPHTAMNFDGLNERIHIIGEKN